MTSPFLNENYTSDRNIVSNAVEQLSQFLYIKSDKSETLEEIKKNLSEHLVPNNGEFKDRNFKILKKNKYGDREVKIMPATTFFEEVQDNNYHLSPSMVAYTHSDEEVSLNSIITDAGIKQRSLYKGKKQEALRNDDDWGVKVFDAMQNAFKIFNNAQSGAMSSNGTPLVNKSGHTSLTSICRCLTSTANMCNERLLAGNRMYNSYERTLECIMSTIVYMDMNKLQRVIDTFNMNYATPDQVISMVRQCSERYWKNKRRFNNLIEFIKKLSPLQLTAVLCTLDLEGMRVCNREVLHKLLSDYSHIPEIPEGAKEEDFIAPDDSDKYILCVSKLMVPKPTKLQINHLNAYHETLLEKWREFIEIFFKTTSPPPGIYDITSMIRDVVLTSDTDSSIYSVDNVVDDFSKEHDVSLRVNGVLTYFIRMISVHQHAQLSKNMNVAQKNLFKLNMKNEFLFGSYVTTIMAKHYYAIQMMIEGVLKAVPSIEIKGVHLRNSKIATKIKKFASDMMMGILEAIQENKLMDAADLLAQVADLERLIMEDIDAGSWAWLTRENVNSKDMYAKGEQSNYRYHLLWNRVFGDKYGMAPPPPYSVVKINAITTNKEAVNGWIKTLDVDMQKRAKEWVGSTLSGKINTVYVPDDLLYVMKRIPKEIVDMADKRSIVKQNLISVYAVLESVGLFIVNENITRLVSDEH